MSSMALADGGSNDEVIRSGDLDDVMMMVVFMNHPRRKGMGGMDETTLFWKNLTGWDCVTVSASVWSSFYLWSPKCRVPHTCRKVRA